MQTRSRISKLIKSKTFFLAAYLLVVSLILLAAERYRLSWMAIISCILAAAGGGLLLYIFENSLDFVYKKEKNSLGEDEQYPRISVGKSSELRDALLTVLEKASLNQFTNISLAVDALIRTISGHVDMLNNGDSDFYRQPLYLDKLLTSGSGKRDNEKDNVFGQELYIDYQILSVSDLSLLLESYHKLFKIFYLVYDNNTNDQHYHDFQNMLQIYSAHTGNSINIKTKVGWRPSFKYQDGDLEVEVPRGLAPFILLGLIITYVTLNGQGMYKNWLESKILEVELKQKISEGEGRHLDNIGKTLLNKKTYYEILEIKARLKKQSVDEKQAIQKELDTLYNLSVGNNNFKKVTFQQD